ncbi:MAG: OpgC domain-containing protein [Chloroflexi bacterium]|nr:OpgC domain-containing protein [Chloroflexota bacterium]
MQIVNPDWSYRVPGSRDLRLDLLRGYATMAMVIDHLGSSSWLHPITGGNNFFVSAAEAFVFISGMIVGAVYGATIRKEGYGATMRKALHRAWTLYKLTVILTVSFVAVVIRNDLPWASWLDPQDPTQFLLSVITLRRTFVFVDIPLLYTLLMLLAPGGLFLLKYGRTWLLVGISWAIWFAYQLSPIQSSLPTVIEGNWIFKLPSWQLLFFNAMALGYHREYLSNRLRAVTKVGRYLYFSLMTILLALLIVLYLQESRLLGTIMPEEQSHALMDQLFNKSSLAPGRLIAALIVFQWAFLAITIYWEPLHRRLGWLIPIGQNSLYAYTTHIILLTAYYALIPYLWFYADNEAAVNTLAQIIALTIIYVMIRKRILFNIIPR